MVLSYHVNFLKISVVKIHDSEKAVITINCNFVYNYDFVRCNILIMIMNCITQPLWSDLQFI